ncbi:DUF5926 family protein [Williamsia sterculiae]|uniref:DUF5926 domain-containing protein n=1 Tax=Williamsia sterculiae TaxID=1344003 RepID=A0A1N7H905_9NOCA|nr:DUF5926 family protein [Williamsia sterculiae]SIS21365.1 hypothetical protein SAMN05445060_3735 [Williamsia sterculiae]
MGKSKRGSGPRPGSNRAERVAARRDRQSAAMAPPPRPFAGLAAECDLVALRTFVASATSPVTVRSDVHGDNEVRLATILPGAVGAVGREQVGLAALQTDPVPDDVAGGLGAALAWAVSAAADDTFSAGDESIPLAEVIDPDQQLEITVHDDFRWWFADAEPPAEIRQMVEQAGESILPTARLDVEGPGAPWWVDAGERAHLRWIRPEDEDAVMSALARVHAAGGLTLGEGSRFAGSFRTHGLLVPVFDLDPEMHPDEWLPGCAEFDRQLTQALAQTGDLSTAERRSRDGIRGRQVTLR